MDDYADIVAGARKDAENHPAYDSGYYQGGYPPADRGACTVRDSQHGAAAARKRLLRLQEAHDGHRALPFRRFESAVERTQGLAMTVGAASALPALAPAASAESVPAALALALSSALAPPALALASAALPPSITSHR